MQPGAEAQDSHETDSGDASREVVVLQAGTLEPSRLRSILVPLLHPVAFGRHKTDAQKRLRRFVVEVSRDAGKGLNRRDHGGEGPQRRVLSDQTQDRRVVIDAPGTGGGGPKREVPVAKHLEVTGSLDGVRLDAEL